MEPGWHQRLEQEFSKPYMVALKEYLRTRKTKKVVIYPHSANWFHAFSLTPFEAVKVVVLGQDPYHGPGQAHGLSFSVPEGVRPPPSLVNIYKEINSDLGLEIPASGCLESWARQGVFLLNSVLTVEQGQAAAHQGRGWEDFTDRAIQVLNDEREHLVFLLWGSYAQKKGAIIDSSRHLVLRSPHPSPLSAHRGFLGCGHFSKANEYLASHGQEVIDWSVPVPEPA
ncbi:MAG: uracil-DNA glycosylase [Gammaproteobacteria bacterium]|nr:uracil-DNA glycosylase [Gammaproteobacteria bacterium]